MCFYIYTHTKCSMDNLMQNLLEAALVTLGKTLEMVRALKVQIGQSLKKSAEYFFLETVHILKSLFSVLGSISVTEVIMNCMI